MHHYSFVRHALIYGLGGVLVQLASFVLLPVYARCLHPADFGSLEVLTRAGEFVVIILLYGGIRQAALAFHGQSQGPAEQARVVATTVVLVGATALAGCCLTVLVSGLFDQLLDLGSPGLFRLAIWATILDGMSFVLLVGPQARDQSLFFVSFTSAQGLLRVGSGILFVVGFAWGLHGVLLAAVLACGLPAVLLGAHQFLRNRGRFDLALARDMITFALLFLPGGFAFFTLNHGDRFILRHYAGLEEVGRYALGYKLALAVVLLNRASVGMVWNARQFAAATARDASAVFGRVFTRCLAAYVAAGLVVCIFQDELVAALGGGAYTAAAHIVAPIVLAYYFLTGADMMDAAFYINRRPGLKTMIALTSTILTCLLYFGLIPLYGAVGAALATLGGFVGHFLLTLVVSQRLFPVRYEGWRLCAIFGSAVFCWLASRAFPAGTWSIAAKAVLLALWPAILWATGLVSAEEKEWIIINAATTWTRLATALGARPGQGVDLPSSVGTGNPKDR
jgi:O-antigen/teichoic acid export membrane protein